MAAQQQGQPQPHLGLPTGLNPDALDTLSDLAIVLSRLRTPGTDSSAASGSNTTATNNTSLPSSAPASAAPLPLKDLPSQSDQLRHRFQKARALVRTLPDMDRGVGEQEAEIAALESRIALQRETLEKLKALGSRFAATSKDDVVADRDRMEE
ncbi:RNA polymerase II transcription mediator complex subunit 9-domain-containing protein [Microdochium bolleyi]|uniref:Mediator of RNA polymerase II transcription subunit 9 n=1 Tax=Microdochium bolleyi TaxID=196109 RepID=A0A136J0J9_9PEZI|nr:RNA polymerase II transcription mediator complex subunit 9-domain-containing protein [Microdochium bolleyi]